MRFFLYILSCGRATLLIFRLASGFSLWGSSQNRREEVSPKVPFQLLWKLSPCVSQWFSKGHHWTSSVSITWEVVKNGDSQGPPWSTLWDSLYHSSKPYTCSTLNQSETHLPQGSGSTVPLSFNQVLLFWNFRNGGACFTLSHGRQ